MKHRISGRCEEVILLFLILWCARAALAQDNYEIQVYGADTVAPHTTMLELHSNFTIDGSKAVPGSPYASDGTYPTNHAEHETVEITHGITNWSEVGFYIFTSASQQTGWQWVGDRISSACARARPVEMARRRQPIHGVRLPARAVLSRHLDP